MFTFAGNAFGKPNDRCSISIERGPIPTCSHEKISSTYIDRLTTRAKTIRDEMPAEEILSEKPAQ